MEQDHRRCSGHPAVRDGGETRHRSVLRAGAAGQAGLRRSGRCRERVGCIRGSSGRSDSGLGHGVAHCRRRQRPRHQPQMRTVPRSFQWRPEQDRSQSVGRCRPSARQPSGLRLFVRDESQGRGLVVRRAVQIPEVAGRLYCRHEDELRGPDERAGPHQHHRLSASGLEFAGRDPAAESGESPGTGRTRREQIQFVRERGTDAASRWRSACRADESSGSSREQQRLRQQHLQTRKIRRRNNPPVLRLTAKAASVVP